MNEFDININEENNIILMPNEEDNPLIEKNSSSDIEQLEQNDIKIKLIELTVEYTNVSEILSKYKTNNIVQDKDNFDLIKFSIKVEAVFNYKWDVYHKPSEIKQNLENIISELEQNQIHPQNNIQTMLEQITNWNDSGIIKLHENDIKNYYSILFNNSQIYNTLSFKEFFNISSTSFNQDNEGNKPFEGYVYKKADPHCLRKAFSIVCCCIEYFAFAQYNLRWLVVTDDYIFYLNKSNSKKGKNLYFFDNDTDININRTEIDVTNSSRSLKLKFKTIFESNLWYNEIKTRFDKKKARIAKNPYQAYTDMKKGNNAHWFIDGEKYFADLAEKLMKAEESIFITDWWLSPEVFLIRPVPINSYITLSKFNSNIKENPPYSRLMDILYQCAIRGVKIYIQVYAENSFVMTLNSVHTQNTLTQLHPNIRVIRHPLNKLAFLYSHHEKLVIIDQRIGYVGGIDLCWGRYDTNAHPIFEPENKSNDIQYFFPGIDYSNTRIRDFNKVYDYLKESAIRGEEARMPWHDIHCRIIGPAVIDIARHFVERWNFSNFGKGEGITEMKQSSSSSIDFPNKQQGFLMGIINNLYPKDKKNGDKTELLIQNEEKNELINMKENLIENDNNQDNEGENIIITNSNPSNGQNGLRGKRKIFKKNLISNDDDDDEDDEELTEKEKKLREAKKNFYRHKKRLNNNSYYIKNNKEIINEKNKRNIDKNETIEEEIEINTDSNLINENNNNNNNNQKEKPVYYNKLVNYASKSKYFGKLIGRENDQEEKLENKITCVNFFKIGIKSEVQVLRSASEWSVGIKKKENSIYQAYIKLIRESQHYIYIENQFFVSKPFDEDDRQNCNRKNRLSNKVENTIAYEIRKRIIKAYEERKKFRVMILIPLIPGFPGDPEKEGTIQIIMDYTFKAICRNYGTSIIEKLKEKMGDEWKKYIGFYSLRGHALANGKPITEIIYIHSKLMIVDDKKVIIGSANINDRSMLGKRDSEFCVLIHEKEKKDSIMNGQEIKVANFAHSLRTNLMAEHMGLDPKDKFLVDPLSDELWDKINNTAKNNTEIFRKLFYCYPDDNMKTFEEARKAIRLDKLENKELEDLKELYQKEKNNIKGHIVEFPLHYFEDEVLGIPFFSLENFAPEECYI